MGFLFFILSSVAANAVTIYSSSCDNAETGWTYTNTGGASIQQSGYWLIDVNTEYVVSETFDLSSYINLVLEYDIRAYGSGSFSTSIVEFSSDNGATWNAGTFTTSTTTTSYVTQTFNVGTIASSTVKFRFNRPTVAARGVRIDNILFTGDFSANPCTTPNPATNLTFNSVTINSLNGSFNAASGGADGYIVVRKTSAGAPSPVDGTSYSVGAGLGGQIIQDATSTTFSDNSLGSGTTYYYYVFAYNNAGCTGGPKYSSVLAGSQATNTPTTAIQFTSGSGTVTEGTATFTLTLSILFPSGSNATSATVSLAGGNARVNGFTSQVVTWAAGDNANKTITLNITDNSTCDGSANLTFNIGSVSGGTSASVGATGSFALTINDNDLTTGTQYGQGFESSGGVNDNWSITSGTGTTQTSAQRTGTNGRQLWGSPSQTDTYNSVNITGYTNTQISFYIEGVGGLENADRLEVYAALNGASFSSTPEVIVYACTTGTSNVSWSYTANGVGIDNVDGVTSEFTGCSSINGIAKVTLNVPDGNTSIALRLVAITNSNSEYFRYDDLTLSADFCAAPIPTIVTSTNSLNFGNVTVGSNATQTYTVEGTDLTAPIVVTPPTGYQVSTNGVNFFNSLSLTPTAGTVNTTTITVRFSPISNVAYNGNITHTSTGATQQDVALAGTGVSPCATPGNQATNLVLTPGATSIGGSFTAAVGGADGYLVVLSTSASLGANPSNTNTYTAGQTIGSGTVVSSGTGTTFTASGLTTTTQYYFFVFAYNNVNCTGGPLYRTPALVNNATTLASPYQAFDNFNRADNSTVGIPSSGGAVAWSEVEATAGLAEIYNNRLDINNTSPQGEAYTIFDMTGKYSTTYDNATSELVWYFNMAQTRPNPSGFGSSNYGVAMVLGATNSNYAAAGSGYAVVLGESGSNDRVKLVRFTGGLTAGTMTDLVADGPNTGGINGDNMFDVQVKYNPSTHLWTLYVHDGGYDPNVAFNFADPTTVSYGGGSTVVDQTYTSTNLPYAGGLWSYATSSGEFASFDNLNIPTAQACQNTWTGAVSTNWFDAANWSCGVVPTAADDVVIPNVSSTTNRFPLINAGLGTTAAVRDLTINSGASVTITATVIGGFPQSTNDLEIYGNLVNNGNANWGTGTVTFKGSTAQTVSGNNNFQYLTLDNNFGLTLLSGTQKVYGTLALKAGTLNTNSRLTIGSNANYTGLIDEFSAGYTGGINGSITVERYANNTASPFFYIGAPVGGAVISGWADDFSLATMNGATDGSQVVPLATCSPTALAQGSPYGGLFDYRENTVNTCNLEGWHVRTTGAIVPGQGFIGRVPAGTTIDLSGSFVTAQTVTGPALTKTANASGRPAGMNLVANPFAAPIDWQAVAAANTSSVMGTAYFYQTSGPLAGAYVPVNSVTGGQEIGSSQAFIVEALNNGVTMSFTDNMKRNGANQYLRTGAAYDQLLTLDVTGNGFADRAHVAFGADFTAAFDSEFDARKLMSKPEQPSLYVNDGSLLYSIYAQPSVAAVQIVPVDFVAGTNGTFTIDADLNAFDPTALVFLEDRLLGTMTNLQMVSSYTFTATVNDAADRFALHFYPGMEVVTNDATCDGNDGNITFNQPGTTEWTLELVDANGVVVYANAAFNGNFTLGNVMPSIYTLNLVHASGYTVSKLYLVNGPAPIVAAFTAPAVATEGDDVMFANTAVNATSYLWNFGDGAISTDANPTHVYTYPGEYLVELVVSNGTCQESITQLVTIEAKLASNVEDLLDGKVKIYAYGTDINIQLNNLENHSSVEVLDIMGRVVVANTQLGFVNGTFVINMEDAANGYYFVRLHNTEDTIIKKVFVNSVK